MVDPHISNRLKLGDGAPAESAPFRFAEFTMIRLTRDVEADGRTLPAGTEGMIVDAQADGVHYGIEFETPFAALVVLTAADFAG